MTLKSKAVSKCAAVLFLLPAVMLPGCQKQNNAQTAHEKPAAHENVAAPQNTAGDRHQRLRAVCADDIQKYCANADRMRRCLKENIDKLSDACRTAVSQRGGRRARDNNGADD